jgi:hypothetical protein
MGQRQTAESKQRRKSVAVLPVRSLSESKEEALTWLKKAIEAGWRDYQMALLDPWLENLRGNEQFGEMMAHVKARVDEMRKRVEEMERKERLTSRK